MKSRFTKISALILAAAMTLSFAACGKKEPSPSDGGTASNGGSTSNADGKVKLPIVDKPLTIKFLSFAWGTATYTPDMPTFKELSKRTNINFDWEVLPLQNPAEKFNLIMASGQLPDLVSYGDQATILKYATQGAFIPLEGQIKKYAPNIQKQLDSPSFPIEHFKAEMTAADGHIYSIPVLTPVSVGEQFFIRGDWLKKLNLKMPETTDDLYKVLKAFKEKDPNGNGKPDEMPFVPDSKHNDVTLLGNAFGAHENFYVDKDNTIKFGPIDEKDRYIESLTFANKLYSEGLMDPEYLSLTTDQFRAKNTKHVTGMMSAWAMSGLGYANTLLKQENPDYYFEAMLPVKGPHGDRFKERPQPKVIYRTMISKSNKNVEATMKLLDYLYSEEGQILWNYGIEGQTYTMVNGKPQFTDFVVKNPDKKTPADVRAQFGMQMALPAVYSWECELAATPDPDVRNAYKLYLDANVIAPIFPNLPLTEEEASQKASIQTQLNTYLEENLNKFIMGKEPIANYDKFVAGLKNIGIDKLMKIYNDSYKRYLEFDKK